MSIDRYDYNNIDDPVCVKYAINKPFISVVMGRSKTLQYLCLVSFTPVG